MKKAKFLLLSILALFCCCEDGSNDYRYPSVVTDYACIITDVKGSPESLLLDDGREYPIAFTDEYQNAHTQQYSYKADTVYRVVSIYELGADSIAYVYSMILATSKIPTPLREGEKLYQDPAYLQCCWHSGGYLNMVMELKALDGEHHVGFVDTTPKEMEGKEFTFYHNANNDIESYRQKLYVSIPLTPFKNDLQQGDTLRIVVNTYDKGIIRQEFAM